MFATFGQGMAFLGYLALALFACSAPTLWAYWIHRGHRWAWKAAAVPTVPIALVTMASGELIWPALVLASVGGAVYARTRLTPAAQTLTAILVVAAGLPLYAGTAIVALLAVAAFGCAPDAGECPL